MSLSSQQRWQQTTSVGVNEVIPVQFKFFDATDLTITRTRASLDTVLTNVTNYAVTGGGSPAATGTVTLVGGLAGDKVTIAGGLALTQLVDLTTDGPLPAPTLTAMFDRLCMEIQQLRNDVDRSLKISATSPAQTALSLTARVGGLVGFDASTGDFVVVPSNGFLSAGAQIRLDITAWTGGTFNCLDTIPSSLYRVGSLLYIQPGGTGYPLNIVQKVNTTDANVFSSITQPPDYNAVTNAFKWVTIA